MVDHDNLREREVAALERAVALVGEHLAAQSVRRGFVERWATPATVLISALGIAITIYFSLRQVEAAQVQQRASAEQFDLSLRQGQYSDIVTGLASSSVGVQVNSIRRLVQHVEDPDNFQNDAERQAAAENTVQTLDAFIEDESTIPGREGLTDFRDPQPVVVSRAVRQLRDLLALEEFSDIAVDLSRGNFHGVDLPDVRLEGKVFAVGADFRMARITGWRLQGTSDLTGAFFTCANLRESDFGRADVSAADFTGADLGGADLSEVSGLTTAQLRGARIREFTELPDGVAPPPGPEWGVRPDGDWAPSVACRDLVETMAGLVGGAGYSSRFPCPGGSGSSTVVRLAATRLSTLERVCDWREDGTGPSTAIE